MHSYTKSIALNGINLLDYHFSTFYFEKAPKILSSFCVQPAVNLLKEIFLCVYQWTQPLSFC